MEEFKTFTAELRDFFNAGSLTGGWAGWARFVSKKYGVLIGPVLTSMPTHVGSWVDRPQQGGDGCHSP